MGVVSSKAGGADREIPESQQEGTPNPSEPIYNSNGILVEYAIQSDAFSWLTSDWTTALWIVFSLFAGLVFGALYYCVYLILKEILMLFPVDLIDATIAGTAWDTLNWPIRIW